MENMLENFVNYSPIKNMYKNQKRNILLNAREIYKRRKEILIAFEENMFPLPKPYVFGENEWKERYIGNEEFMRKPFKLSFLEEHNHSPLSDTETELLDRDFGYKNIDELVDAFNNKKTNEQFNKLFNKIADKLSTLKKLVKMVSDATEKKRINNAIKGVEFVLDCVASLGDSDTDFSSFDFSNTKGKGLIILKPNQMLSRLPISLAQLKAENNSGKLKNETRQLLYFLYRSKKLTKKFYKSLVDIT